MCRDVSTQPLKILELDVRTGGRYVFEVTTDKGDLYLGQGTYREVRPPEKLVFTWAWKMTPAGGGPAKQTPETQVTVEFHTRGSSTEVVLTHEFFKTAKDREEHNQGWIGCFNALEKALQS